jgi:hypothetical protein
LGSFLDALSWP